MTKTAHTPREKALSAYARLVERGCLCGTDQPARCPIHTGPSDNRGIRAWFQAGMPGGFPFEASCAICDAPGLMYPNVEIDDPKGSGEYKPTLVCPRCSKPANERALRREAEQFGHALNPRTVFGVAA